MSMDLRNKEFPTHVCACGSQLWNVKCMFQDYEISMYMLDMECYSCGALATAPTLVDMPEGYIGVGENREEDY
jgi:hypothetical protein